MISLLDFVAKELLAMQAKVLAADVSMSQSVLELLQQRVWCYTLPVCLVFFIFSFVFCSQDLREVSNLILFILEGIQSLFSFSVDRNIKPLSQHNIYFVQQFEVIINIHRSNLAASFLSRSTPLLASSKRMYNTTITNEHINIFILISQNKIVWSPNIFLYNDICLLLFMRQGFSEHPGLACVCSVDQAGLQFTRNQSVSAFISQVRGSKARVYLLSIYVPLKIFISIFISFSLL